MNRIFWPCNPVINYQSPPDPVAVRRRPSLSCCQRSRIGPLRQTAVKEPWTAAYRAMGEIAGGIYGHRNWHGGFPRTAESWRGWRCRFRARYRGSRFLSTRFVSRWRSGLGRFRCMHFGCGRSRSHYYFLVNFPPSEINDFNRRTSYYLSKPR